MPMSPRLLRPRAVATTGFDPRNVSGNSLWLDASVPSSLTLVSGAVSVWNDLSGNGRNFSQTTANNRPAYVAVSQNGRGGVDFDGSNDSLYSEFVAVRSEVSVFVAASFDDNTSRRPLIDIARNGAASRFFVIEQNTFGGVGQRYGLYHANKTFDSATATSSGAKVFSILYTFASNQSSSASIIGGIDYRVNSTSSAINDRNTASNSSADYSTVDRAGVMLGSFNNDGTSFVTFHDGRIFEVLIYSRRVSVTEAQRIESYLMAKWGIT